jgi:transglutaminase-like putative cysteine protease
MIRVRPLAWTALVAYSIVTVATCWRLFAGWDFLIPLVTAALLGHGVSTLLRRAGWGSLPTLLASLFALAVFVTLALYPETSAYGLPTRATWDALWPELVDAWQALPEAVAPVPAEGGFLAAAIIGTWLLAHLSDDLAHHGATVFETIVPQSLLFVTATSLGGPRMRLVAVALWLVALAGAIAALRAEHPRGASWYGGVRRGAGGAMLGGALALATTAAAVAVVAGPHLPGSGSEALLDPGGSSSNRSTVSPLVDIRARLVNQSNLEVFTVAAAEPAYWRLTALDEFDGRIWRATRRYSDADRSLSGGVSLPFTRPLEQRFQLTGLESIWLPAAYAPVQLSNPELAGYDPGTASLLAREGVGGETAYTVVSRIPTLDPAILRASPGGLPEDIGEQALQLPGGFSDELVAEAQRRTAGPTRYDQALSLQSWFRSEFEYSLGVPPGHDTGAIEGFLARKVGYCEQFAGTFAAFARAVGIPTRVAVGFTQGQLDEDDGLFHVRGRNMHAWPEVYFAGIGWVPFEPTPGRGAPGNESYTLVAPDQAEQTEAEGVETPATAAPGEDAGTPAAADIPPEDLAGLAPSPDGAVADGDASSVSRNIGRWMRRILVVAVAIAAVAGLWVLVAPHLRAARWRRRRSAAADARERVLVDWHEAVSDLRRYGYDVSASETPLEMATRLGGRPGADELAPLAEQATVAAYGDAPVTEDEERDAHDRVRTLQAGLRRHRDLRHRISARLDVSAGASASDR